ncbi:MAG: hypothetical protein WBJ06_05500 [Candidatus Methanoculleus thermohydrogenotrophicum]
MRDLKLAPGTPVTLSTKSTAVHVIRG